VKTEKERNNAERRRGRTQKQKQRRGEEQKLKEEEILEKTQNRERAESSSNSLEPAAPLRGTAQSAFPLPLSSCFFFLCSVVSTVHMQSE
jgi:hypothetical protein